MSVERQLSTTHGAATGSARNPLQVATLPSKRESTTDKAEQARINSLAQQLKRWSERSTFFKGDLSTKLAPYKQLAKIVMRELHAHAEIKFIRSCSGHTAMVFPFSEDRKRSTAAHYFFVEPEHKRFGHFARWHYSVKISGEQSDSEWLKDLDETVKGTQWVFGRLGNTPTSLLVPEPDARLSVNLGFQSGIKKAAYGFRTSWLSRILNNEHLWAREAQIFARPVFATRNSYRSLRKIIAKAGDNFFRDQFNRLRGELDQDILKALSPAVTKQDPFGFPIHDYNFCAATHSPEARINRARWITSFTGFARFDVLTESRLACVDTGASFVEFVSGELGIPAATVRKLRTWAPDTFTTRLRLPVITDVDNRKIPIAFALEAAREFDQGALPDLSRDTPQSVAFYAAVFCTMFATHTDVKDLVIGTERTANLARLISRSAMHWNEVSNYFKSLEHFKSSKDVSDFLAAGQRALFYIPLMRSPDLIPEITVLQRLAANSNKIQDEFIEVLAEHYDIAQLMRDSAKWHHKGKATSLYFTWVALTDTVKAPNGCVLQPLTDSVALAEEGEALEHCVGGWGSKCATGPHYVYSLQSATGEKLSTLAFTEGKNGLEIEQHGSRKNEDPPPNALEAATWFERELKAGKFSIDWDAIKARRAINAKRDAAATLCGVELEDERAVHRLYEGTQKFFPSQMAATTLKEHESSPKLRAMLSRFVERISSEPAEKDAEREPEDENVEYP